MDFCKQISMKQEWMSACDDALRDLMSACRRTNQKGELLVKLKVEPSLDKEGQTIATMRLDVKVNCPRNSPGIQTAYVVTDEEDNAVDLSKDHPQQMAMFARFEKEHRNESN